MLISFIFTFTLILLTFYFYLIYTVIFLNWNLFTYFTLIIKTLYLTFRVFI